MSANVGIHVIEARYERKDGTGIASIVIEGPPDALIERAREIFSLFLGGEGLWRLSKIQLTPIRDEPHRWRLVSEANLIRDDVEFSIEADLETPGRIHSERGA